MIGRIFLATIFLISGSLHFLAPGVYLRIMPPYLPAHKLLVYLSGAAELLGAIGLLIPSTRQAAAWGLIVLLIAVLPANIYMATSHLRLPGIMGQSWAQWLRVPLQIPLIYWAWLYTRR
ncbi:DoxX family protein [Tunturibacter empetritectus]|uniref:Membrane protein n=1 Tax=Tunturiibacter lichenicola TaxID=2051959 RepID=A0A7W8JD27_9BACT|nr:DoxX family membrane protein [Edaphobacter lichenicola]MBB5345644.1 putative membrane protein [Edaphobacter lichenicola]